MYRVAILISLLILLLAGCGQKEETAMTQPSPDLQSLIDAERAFAAQVYVKGVRGAFLANLAEISVVFNPLPVNGALYYEQHEDKPTLLEWEPAFADISRAGRMGYTTGPWKFRADSSAPEPSVFGHYVSIWKRPPGGDWKVVLDIGVPHAKPDSAVTLTWPPEPTEGKAQVVVDYETAQNALMDVDRKLSEASLADGFVEALLAESSDDLRVYRAGAFPAHGKEATRNLLADVNGFLSWEPDAASVARSGDLGYTYGTADWRAVADDPEPQKRFSYVRIWKKGENKGWQVVLDIALEQPPVEAEAGQ